MSPQRSGPISYDPHYLDKELRGESEMGFVIPQPQYKPHPMYVVTPHHGMQTPPTHETSPYSSEH